MTLEEAKRVLALIRDAAVQRAHIALDPDRITEAITIILSELPGGLEDIKASEPWTRVTWEGWNKERFNALVPCAVLTFPEREGVFRTIILAANTGVVAAMCISIAGLFYHQGYTDILKEAIRRVENGEAPPADVKFQRPLDDRGYQYPWPKGTGEGE